MLESLWNLYCQLVSPRGKTCPASGSDQLLSPSRQDSTVSNETDAIIPPAPLSLPSTNHLELAQSKAENDWKMPRGEGNEAGDVERVEPAPIQLPLVRTAALSGSHAEVSTEPTRLDRPLSQSISIDGRRRTTSDSPSQRSSARPPSAQTKYRQDGHNVSNNMRKLGDMLGTLLGAQLRVQEARTRLRNHRHSLANLDRELVRKLHIILATAPNAELESLVQLGENVAASRDEINPMEDDYNALEDQLIRDEFKLKEAITSLAPQLERNSGAFPPEDEIVSLVSDPDDGLAPIPSPDGEVQHPGLGDYLSRLGDVQLAEERLDELRRERAHLVEEQRIRSPYGLGLSQESHDFLDSFDARHQEYQGQVTAAQLELDRVKGLLALSGLKDMDPYIINVLDDQATARASTVSGPQVESSSSFMMLDDRPSRSAPPSRPPSPRDWIEGFQNPRLDPLLSAADDTSPVFPVPDKGERGSIDTNTYINEWLFNRLRRSSLDVMRFRSAERLQSQGPAALPTADVERAGTRKVRSDSGMPTIDVLAGRFRRTGPCLRMSDVVRENTSGRSNFWPRVTV